MLITGIPSLNPLAREMNVRIVLQRPVFRRTGSRGIRSLTLVCGDCRPNF